MRVFSLGLTLFATTLALACESPSGPESVVEGTGMRPVDSPCLAQAARDHGLIFPKDGGKC